MSKDRPAALLVEPGKAPRLSSIDTKDLINFKEKYQHYIDLLEDARKQGAGAAAYPRAIKTMIDPSLLTVICQHHLKVPKQDLTDQALLQFFYAQLEADTSSQRWIPRIMASELKINLYLRPKARMTDLLVQMETLTKHHNWKQVFSSSRGKKNQIRFLIQALQPQSFKTFMTTTVRYTKPELEDDIEAFFEVLINNVETFEADLKRERNRSGSFSRLKRPMSHNNNRPDPKKQKFTGSCLKCGKPEHHIKACPMKPSPDEQKRLIA